MKRGRSNAADCCRLTTGLMSGFQEVPRHWPTSGHTSSDRAPEMSLSRWPMFPRPIKPSAMPTANREHKPESPDSVGPRPQVQPLPLLALGSQAPMTSLQRHERCERTKALGFKGQQVSEAWQSAWRPNWPFAPQTSSQLEAPSLSAVTRGPCTPPGGSEGLSKYPVAGQAVSTEAKHVK